MSGPTIAGRAVVLGGGGVAGIAWMTGLAAGLHDAGVDLRQAGLMIGTSAGATVAAQLRSGVELDDLFARQTIADLQVAELVPDSASLATMTEALTAAARTTPADALLRRIGEFAVAGRTVAAADRRAVIAARLPSSDWPTSPLLVTSVDAASGELKTFAAASGVDLIDAVSASCAVPGIWPAVAIGNRRYIDGGLRSYDNADLARGADTVLVISPMGADAPALTPLHLADQLRLLENDGAGTSTIEPDAPSRAAMGANPFAAETRAGSAQAGRAQGRAIATAIATFLTGR